MDKDHAKLVERLTDALGHERVKSSGSTRLTAFPSTAAEISQVLQLAAEYGAVVTPVGKAFRGRRNPSAQASIVIDMARMNHVLHLDETSLVVQAQAGLTGLDLETLLQPRGLTIGDFAPAALRASLGGLLSVRTPGKASPRHGAFEDAVLGLSAVLPDGRTVHTRVAPRRATGPDLARALLGAEGRLGVITSVVLRIYRRPEIRFFASRRFASLGNAISAVQRALRQGARPAAVRVYDAEEACAHLGDDIASGEQAILVVATVGPPELASVDRGLFTSAADLFNAVDLSAAPAERWYKRRWGHDQPGTMPPLPTLEVMAGAQILPAVHQAVMRAAREAQAVAVARTHLSRFDRDGACMFVTLLDEGGQGLTSDHPFVSVIEEAARGAGAFLIGESDETWEPYLADLRKQLDPNSVMGALQ